MAEQQQRRTPRQQYESPRRRRRQESTKAAPIVDQDEVPGTRAPAPAPALPSSSSYPQQQRGPAGEEGRRIAPSYASSLSSSSSSYIDISRTTFPANGSNNRSRRGGGGLGSAIRAFFFTAPSERRRRRGSRHSGGSSNRPYGRAVGGSGSSASSSSLNTDLAYGSGYIRRRRRGGADRRREREKAREDDNAARRDPRADRDPRANEDPRADRDSHEAILEVGAGLAALARKQNRLDMAEARRQGIAPPRRNNSGILRGGESNRGLGPSRVSHGPDEEGWESATDADSETSSVDSRLAYGHYSGHNKGSFFRPKPKRKESVVDPSLFGPANSLHGIIQEPVGFDDVDHDNLSDYPPPTVATTEKLKYPPSTAFPPREQSVASAIASATGPLQHVSPVPTSDPNRFEAIRSSGQDSFDPRPGPVPMQQAPVEIQQPQPKPIVSQSVFEPPYSTRSETKVPSSSGRAKSSVAGAALAGVAGVAGVAIGAAMGSDRRDERKDRDRRGDVKDPADDDRRAERRKDDLRERPDLKEGADDRREKRGDRDGPEETREERRERRRREKREDPDYERREKRRERRRDEDDPDDKSGRRQEEKYNEGRDSRDEEGQTRKDAPAVPPLDPFQYQVADDAFKTPDGTRNSVPFSSIQRARSPAVVTVERVPHWHRDAPAKDEDEVVKPSEGIEKGEDQETRDGQQTAREAETLYEEIEHSTIPVEATAVGAAIAAEENRYSREKVRKRRYDRSGDSSPSGERDPIQEEADRIYREAILARKIAESHNDDPVIRVVTPPEMAHRKDREILYPVPNADFELDHIMDPVEFRTSPTKGRGEGFERIRSLSGVAKNDLNRPLLTLVRPTPKSSPAPEQQNSRSERRESSRDEEASDRKDRNSEPTESSREAESPESQKKPAVDTVVAEARGDANQTPTSANGAKAVKWGQNDTKLYEVESPYETKNDPIATRMEASNKQERPKMSQEKKASAWGALKGAFMSGAAAEVVAKAIESSTDATSDRREKDTKPERAAKEERPEKNTSSQAQPFEYRGVVVEPEHSDNEVRERGPPAVGPKPSKLPGSNMPGAFDDDLDFTATLAAGLEDSGFDPNIVIKDPTYRRRSSPPGSDEPPLAGYKQPYAETVSDLSQHPAPRSETSRDIKTQDDGDYGKDRTKKEQRKRDKAEKGRRDESRETDLSEKAPVTHPLVEEPESLESSKSSKKEKRRDKTKGSKDSYNDADDRSNKRVSVPVDAYDDLRAEPAQVEAADEWDTPKKSKRKSKRDSDQYDSPSRTMSASDVTSLTESSKKKSKDRSSKRSSQYDSEPNPEDVPLPSASEISRDDEYDSRKSRSSSKRSSSIPDSVDRDARSVKSDSSRYADDDDSRSSKKEKKNNGFFSGIFGSSTKSEPERSRATEESESKKRIKRSKRSSTGDGSEIYGSDAKSDYSAAPNGNGDKNYGDDAGDPKRSTNGNGKNGKSDEKEESFLGNAGTLGAGVGLAAAVAIAAQHQQSKAATAEIEDQVPRRPKPEHATPAHAPAVEPSRELFGDDVLNPDIVERQIRPSFDPQYGDFLPLPPSDPGSPNIEADDDALPSLPESRPNTPPNTESLKSRDRSVGSSRRTELPPLAKTPSGTAVPIKFNMGNRSTPSSPGLVRPQSVSSPSTMNADGIGLPRPRPRPKSWDSSKELQPLHLLDPSRRAPASMSTDSEMQSPVVGEDASAAAAVARSTQFERLVLPPLSGIENNDEAPSPETHDRDFAAESEAERSETLVGEEPDLHAASSSPSLTGFPDPTALPPLPTSRVSTSMGRAIHDESELSSLPPLLLRSGTSTPRERSSEAYAQEDRVPHVTSSAAFPDHTGLPPLPGSRASTPTVLVAHDSDLSSHSPLLDDVLLSSTVHHYTEEPEAESSEANRHEDRATQVISSPSQFPDHTNLPPLLTTRTATPTGRVAHEPNISRPTPLLDDALSSRVRNNAEEPEPEAESLEANVHDDGTPHVTSSQFLDHTGLPALPRSRSSTPMGRIVHELDISSLPPLPKSGISTPREISELSKLPRLPDSRSTPAEDRTLQGSDLATAGLLTGAALGLSTGAIALASKHGEPAQAEVVAAQSTPTKEIPVEFEVEPNTKDRSSYLFQATPPAKRTRDADGGSPPQLRHGEEETPSHKVNDASLDDSIAILEDAVPAHIITHEREATPGALTSSPPSEEKTLDPGASSRPAPAPAPATEFEPDPADEFSLTKPKKNKKKDKKNRADQFSLENEPPSSSSVVTPSSMADSTEDIATAAALPEFSLKKSKKDKKKDKKRESVQLDAEERSSEGLVPEPALEIAQQERDIVDEPPGSFSTVVPLSSMEPVSAETKFAEEFLPKKTKKSKKDKKRASDFAEDEDEGSSSNIITPAVASTFTAAGPTTEPLEPSPATDTPLLKSAGDRDVTAQHLLEDADQKEQDPAEALEVMDPKDDASLGPVVSPAVTPTLKEAAVVDDEPPQPSSEIVLPSSSLEAADDVDTLPEFSLKKSKKDKKKDKKKEVLNRSVDQEDVPPTTDLPLLATSAAAQEEPNPLDEFSSSTTSKKDKKKNRKNLSRSSTFTEPSIDKPAAESAQGKQDDDRSKAEQTPLPISRALSEAEGPSDAGERDMTTRDISSFQEESLPLSETAIEPPLAKESKKNKKKSRKSLPAWELDEPSTSEAALIEPSVEAAPIEQSVETASIEPSTKAPLEREADDGNFESKDLTGTRPEPQAEIQSFKDSKKGKKSKNRKGKSQQDWESEDPPTTEPPEEAVEKEKAQDRSVGNEQLPSEPVEARQVQKDIVEQEPKLELPMLDKPTEQDVVEGSATRELQTPTEPVTEQDSRGLDVKSSKTDDAVVPGDVDQSKPVEPLSEASSAKDLKKGKKKKNKSFQAWQDDEAPETQSVADSVSEPATAATSEREDVSGFSTPTSKAKGKKKQKRKSLAWDVPEPEPVIEGAGRDPVAAFDAEIAQKEKGAVKEEDEVPRLDSGEPITDPRGHSNTEGISHIKEVELREETGSHGPDVLAREVEMPLPHTNLSALTATPTNSEPFATAQSDFPNAAGYFPSAAALHSPQVSKESGLSAETGYFPSAVRLLPVAAPTVEKATSFKTSEDDSVERSVPEEVSVSNPTTVHERAVEPSSTLSEAAHHEHTSTDAAPIESRELAPEEAESFDQADARPSMEPATMHGVTKQPPIENFSSAAFIHSPSSKTPPREGGSGDESYFPSAAGLLPLVGAAAVLTGEHHHEQKHEARDVEDINEPLVPQVQKHEEQIPLTRDIGDSDEPLISHVPELKEQQPLTLAGHKTEETTLPIQENDILESISQAPQEESADGEPSTPYSQEQLEATRQPNEDFPTPKKKSKGKKGRADLSRTSAQDGDSPADAANDLEDVQQPIETSREMQAADEPQPADGLAAGHSEDQIALAKQLQTEYESGSKKSKKGKKSRSTSRAPEEIGFGTAFDDPEAAEVQPVEEISREILPEDEEGLAKPAPDGLAAGFTEEQLEDARQMKESFAPGSKKSKKEKKRKGLLRSATDENISGPATEAGSEETSLAATEVDSAPDSPIPLSTVSTQDDLESPFTTKKGKKGKKRQSLLRSLTQESEDSAGPSRELTAEPEQLEPVISEETATEVASIAPEPIADPEDKSSSAVAEESDPFGFSTKKGKKGKKKRESSLRTTTQEEPAPEPVPEPASGLAKSEPAQQEILEADPNQSRDVVADADLTALGEELNFSLKKSKKDKKGKRGKDIDNVLAKTEDLSQPAERDISENDRDQASLADRIWAGVVPSESITHEQPENPSAESEDPLGLYTTKKSKKNKKRKDQAKSASASEPEPLPADRDVRDADFSKDLDDKEPPTSGEGEVAPASVAETKPKLFDTWSFESLPHDKTAHENSTSEPQAISKDAEEVTHVKQEEEALSGHGDLQHDETAQEISTAEPQTISENAREAAEVKREDEAFSGHRDLQDGERAQDISTAEQQTTLKGVEAPQYVKQDDEGHSDHTSLFPKDDHLPESTAQEDKSVVNAEPADGMETPPPVMPRSLAWEDEPTAQDRSEADSINKPNLSVPLTAYDDANPRAKAEYGFAKPVSAGILAAGAALLAGTSMIHGNKEPVDSGLPSPSVSRSVADNDAAHASSSIVSEKKRQKMPAKSLDRRSLQKDDLFDDPMLWEGAEAQKFDDRTLEDQFEDDTGFWATPAEKPESTKDESALDDVVGDLSSVPHKRERSESLMKVLEPSTVLDHIKTPRQHHNEDVPAAIARDAVIEQEIAEEQPVKASGLKRDIAKDEFAQRDEAEPISQPRDASEDFVTQPSKKAKKNKKKSRLAARDAEAKDEEASTKPSYATAVEPSTSRDIDAAVHEEFQSPIVHEPNIDHGHEQDEAKKPASPSSFTQPFVSEEDELAQEVVDNKAREHEESANQKHRHEEIYLPPSSTVPQATEDETTLQRDLDFAPGPLPSESRARETHRRPEPYLPPGPILPVAIEEEDHHRKEKHRRQESYLPPPPTLPIVFEEEDHKPESHHATHERNINDHNRDSALVTESPVPPQGRFSEDHEYARDSGVHLRDWGETPVSKEKHHVTSADGALSRPSWFDEDKETANLQQSQRPKEERSPKGHATSPALVGAGAAIAVTELAHLATPNLPQRREGHGENVKIDRSITPNMGRLQTPDHSKYRSVSVGSNRSSGTPPLRRSDRKLSGDLRSLSQRSQANLAKEAQDTKEAERSPATSSLNINPIANEGRPRAKDMADVYDGYGEGRIGSPMSPTRPHSMRRRQSMQVLDLESRVEQLAAENRMLAEAKELAEHSLQSSQRAALALADRDAEVDSLKQTLDWLHREVERLKEVNDGLTSANVTLARQHTERYGALESQHGDATRELEDLRQLRRERSGDTDGTAEKDREIAQLRQDLEAAHERIRDLQREILQAKDGNNEFLVFRDEDYFDNACEQLCQHVQQWVLRFSKFSDMRACRRTNEINNDKTIDRLDNAVLDGSDVDEYLSNRIKRRDIFMSMTMSMIWEFVFTRYLFGMDREQRQKLKALERTLSEVGPPAAVNQWRATTLTLLTQRDAFHQQRGQDTEAVVQMILQTLSEILPPPSHLEEQIQEQLTRVVKSAVDLSIEMRTQRAGFMMLPPLQPEYDANGDLARQVPFNAALMNERSGDTISNEDLEAQHAVVRIVLFPLVVKKGDDAGNGDDEIVVCPAQVLAAKPKRHARGLTPEGLGQNANANHSRVSMQSSMPVDQQVPDI